MTTSLEPRPSDNQEGIPGEISKACAGRTADGAPCGTPVHLLRWDEVDECWWCFSHDPSLADERELARRKGGLRLTGRLKRFTYLDASDLPGDLDSPEQAALWAATIAKALAFGRLSSNAGHAALKAIESFLRAHEATDLTARLTALEHKVVEDESRRQREQALRAAERRRTGADYMLREPPQEPKPEPTP